MQSGVDGEGGEVTRIDVLHGEVSRTGREHVAAFRDATQPPGEPSDVLARPEDQARSCEDASIATEDFLDRELGATLVRRVIGCFGVGASLRRSATLR